MFIKKLSIEHFGKFLETNIILKDGINIIYAKNEGGKSTLHSFIRGMLVGIDKPRGRETKEDLYSKYLPWDGRNLYSGSMDFELNGRSYRIYRNFYKDNRQVKILDLLNGKVTEFEPGQPLELLGGLNKSNYSNTISIEQLKYSTDKSLASEVQNYIANVTTSKSNEVNVSEAYLKLISEKKKILSNKTSEKLENLSKELEKVSEKEEKLDSISEKSGDIDWNEKPEDIRQITEMEEYIARYPIIMEKYKQFHLIINEIKEQEAMIRDLNRFQSEYEDSFQEKNIKKIKKNLTNIIYQVPLLILCILVLLAGGKFFKSLLLIGVAATVLIGYLFYILIVHNFFSGRRSKQYKDEMEGGILGSREKDLEQQLIHWKKKLLLSKERAQSLQVEIVAYANQLFDCEKVDERTKEKLESANEQLRKTINYKKLEISHSREKKKMEQQKLKWQMDSLEEDLLKAEDMKVEYHSLLQLLQEEKQKIAAIDLAIRIIDKLASQIHDDFGIKLNAELSELVARQTRGVHQRVFMDEQFQIRMEMGSKIVDLERMSAGTVQQVYLCLRLVVSELLFENHDFPFLLDEPFVYYDDERLLATLEMLFEKKKQILIFTCQSREIELLERMGVRCNLVEI